MVGKWEFRGGIPAMPGSVLSPRGTRAAVVSANQQQVGRVWWRPQRLLEEKKIKGQENKMPPSHSCFCAFLQTRADFDCLHKRSLDRFPHWDGLVTTERAGFSFVNSLAMISAISLCNLPGFNGRVSPTLHLTACALSVSLVADPPNTGLPFSPFTRPEVTSVLF